MARSNEGSIADKAKLLGVAQANLQSHPHVQPFSRAMRVSAAVADFDPDAWWWRWTVAAGVAPMPAWCACAVEPESVAPARAWRQRSAALTPTV